MNKVTRLEVIDHRKYDVGHGILNRIWNNVRWPVSIWNAVIEYDIQDEGRTLKIFINDWNDSTE